MGGRVGNRVRPSRLNCLSVSSPRELATRGATCGFDGIDGFGLELSVLTFGFDGLELSVLTFGFDGIAFGGSIAFGSTSSTGGTTSSTSGTTVVLLAVLVVLAPRSR